MGLCYWINTVSGFTVLDFALCGTYLGFYLGLFGAAFALFSQKTRLPPALTAPPVWISIEYLRSHAGFLGVPWGLLGHTQYCHLPLIQIASLTGVYGISFLIVMVNVTISDALRSWTVATPQAQSQSPPHLLISAVASVSLLGVSLLYGFRILATQPQWKVVKVTVLQGNISQNLRWKPEFRRLNLETHVRLTKEATQAGPTSLVIWPETGVQGSLTQDLFITSTLATLVKETNTPLLVGSLQRPSFGPREFRKKSWFNSASLIAPTKGIVQQYHKIHLFPVGGYLPYQEFLPWPARAVAITDGITLLPGTDYTVFDLAGYRFSVLICWESLFPDLVRRFVANGAELLINITNEAWFGETAAPFQFLAMNVFRAVENRIAIARAANTGISGFIDPYGRITGQVQDQNDKVLFTTGYLTQDVPLARESTVYTMYGDMWAYGNLMVTVGLLSLCSLRASR
jgi:apolipoprotein N-acyltransferase